MYTAHGRLRVSVVEVEICRSIVQLFHMLYTIVSRELVSRSSVLIRWALCRFITGICVRVPGHSLIFFFFELLVSLPNVFYCDGYFKWILFPLQTHSHTYCVASPLLGSYFIKCLYISIYTLPQLCKNVTFWFDVSKGCHSFSREEFFHVQLYQKFVFTCLHCSDV